MIWSIFLSHSLNTRNHVCTSFFSLFLFICIATGHQFSLLILLVSNFFTCYSMQCSNIGVPCLAYWLILPLSFLQLYGARLSQASIILCQQQYWDILAQCTVPTSAWPASPWGGGVSGSDYSRPLCCADQCWLMVPGDIQVQNITCWWRCGEYMSNV